MLYPLLRPFLFSLDPETAHTLAFGSLDVAARCHLAALALPRVPDDPVEVMGIAFPNRIGLAAGLDKNAEHIDGLAAFGFGHIECGTVTPRPQPGNPRPRLFRIVAAQALVNRMGFNNEGLRGLPREPSARPLERDRRPQHRQELRHAQRARGRRLPRVPARRATRTPRTSP